MQEGTRILNAVLSTGRSAGHGAVVGHWSKRRRRKLALSTGSCVQGEETWANICRQLQSDWCTDWYIEAYLTAASEHVESAKFVPFCRRRRGAGPPNEIPVQPKGIRWHLLNIQLFSSRDDRFRFHRRADAFCQAYRQRIFPAPERHQSGY